VKHLDLFDLPDEARDLVRACEVTGERTRFDRAGRGVAVLVSWDEYLALRETLAISNDSLFYAELETAEEQVRQGKMLLVEDLLEG
jgi:PHD/YefM family antitoxin component YafN of YafNO toxin-antitoxin module